MDYIKVKICEKCNEENDSEATCCKKCGSDALKYKYYQPSAALVDEYFLGDFHLGDDYDD